MKSTFKEVVNVLMKRNGMTQKEANSFLKGIMEEVVEYISIGDYENAEGLLKIILG